MRTIVHTTAQGDNLHQCGMNWRQCKGWALRKLSCFNAWAGTWMLYQIYGDKNVPCKCSCCPFFRISKFLCFVHHQHKLSACIFFYLKQPSIVIQLLTNACEEMKVVWSFFNSEYYLRKMKPEQRQDFAMVQCSRSSYRHLQAHACGSAALCIYACLSMVISGHRALYHREGLPMFEFHLRRIIHAVYWR